METPVMSEGNRSGGHGTRLHEDPTLRARARASMVLAPPGTSSNSKCPSQKKPTTERSSCCRLPTMTFSTLPTIFAEVAWTLDMQSSRKGKESPFAYDFRFSTRMTSFNPDHVSSTAQTLTSTRPSGNANARTTSSVTSVGTLAAFFGHETQIAP